MRKSEIELIRNNYIEKRVIRNKIKELEENLKEFEKTDNTGRFSKENSIDYYKIEILNELLGE